MRRRYTVDGALEGARRLAALFVVMGMILAQTVALGVSPARAASPTFQEGVGGYGGTTDTGLDHTQKDLSLGNAASIRVLGATGDDPAVPGLIRFGNVFGTDADQVPPGSTIQSATLTLAGFGDGKKKDSAGLHRVLIPWDEMATWDSLSTSGGGLQFDGVEVRSAADATVTDLSRGSLSFPVTVAVQDWSNGRANLGWALLPSDGATWTGHSSEASSPAQRPLLTIDFIAPNGAPEAIDDSSSTPPGTAVTVAVLDNDSDPDGDALVLTGVGEPSNGTALVNDDGTATYFPSAEFLGEDSFSYAIADAFGATAAGTVRVQVVGADPETTTTEAPATTTTTAAPVTTEGPATTTTTTEPEATTTTTTTTTTTNPEPVLNAAEWGRALPPEAPDLPLAFVPNVGQADPNLDFIARGQGYIVTLEGGDAVLSLGNGASGHQVRMSFRGAADPDPDASGIDLAASSDESPRFSSVGYTDIYPGIDVQYAADGRELEYSFTVQPGVDPATIRLDFSGANEIGIEDDGTLLVDSRAGRDLTATAPFTYQDVNGSRVAIDSAFVVNGDGTVGFAVGPYDQTLPLVIDPTFRSSTSSGSGGGGSIVVTRPAGLQSNDVMVASIAQPTTSTVTPPAGWVPIRSDAFGGAVQQDLFYKVATASEPATYVFTLGASSDTAGAIVAYSGVDTASPVDAQGGQGNGSSTSYTAPSITPTVAGATLVGFFASVAGGPTSPPPGMTERADQGSAAGATEIADEPLSAVGPTGTRSAMGASSVSVGQLVALTPLQSTFVVNSTSDASDNIVGDGLCYTGTTNSQSDPECSLRAAIEEANFAVDVNEIQFNIPTSEGGYSASPLAWTIVPLAPYDDITATVTIDATTQPGFSGDPVIQLDGSDPGAAGATAALTLEADASLIEGFIVHSWQDEGLEIDASTGKGDNNTLRNNWVGIDADENLQTIGDVGILMTVGATGNVVEGNVVGGSASSGIVLRNVGTDGNIVIGNSVGVGPDGSSAIPNGLHGVELYDQPAGNRIGGFGAEGNIIANNIGDGVRMAGDVGANNAILGNAIHNNGELGVDLDLDGVTANAAGDPLNFPDITSATETGGTVTVDFDLDVPDGDYRVEFFANPAGADPSTYGEGEVFVDSIDVSVSAGMPIPASHNFPGSAGDILTATATSGTAVPFGSTSEFSSAATVALAGPPPTGLWLSTAADVGSPSGAPGLDSWSAGAMLAFGDPGLAFEPSATAGTFSLIADLDAQGQDGNVVLDGLDYVRVATIVGASPSVAVQSGDLLLSTANNEVFVNWDATTTATEAHDVILFKPKTPGVYTSGTFSVLLDSPLGAVDDLSLVEAATPVGDQLLPAGSILMTDNKIIYHLDPAGAGPLVPPGVPTVLVDGPDVGLDQDIVGLHLVDDGVQVDGIDLTVGDLLVSLDNTDATTGDNGMPTVRQDVFLLELTRTTAGPVGVAAGDATMFFDGSDVFLDSNDEDVRGLALVGGAPISAPIVSDDAVIVATNSSVVVAPLVNDVDPNGDPLTIQSFTQPPNGSVSDNGDGTLTYTPDYGLVGADSFTYTATDGAESAVATVNVDVFDPVLLTATKDVVVGSGTPGLTAWTPGAVLSLGHPGFVLDPPTTTATVGKLLDLDLFALDGDAKVTAIHDVRTAITIGDGATTFDLLPGDLVLATEDGETLLGGSTVITVADKDLFVFRPASPGSPLLGGEFYFLLDDPNGGSIKAVSVVEHDTILGDTMVEAGTILNVESGGTKRVYAYDVATTGELTTSGTSVELLDLDDVGLGGTIEGIDLIERAVTAGGRTLPEGTLLATTDGETTVDGLPVERFDVFALDVSETTYVAGTTVATASMVFDGSDTFFDDDTENLFALSVSGGADVAAGNTPPVAVDDNAVTTTAKPVIIDVVANDSDVDLDPLTVVEVLQGSDGTVVDNGDGTVTYTSDPAFVGVDVFSYRISDGNGSTDTGLVTVTVDPAFVVNSTGDASDNDLLDGLCDTGGTNSASDPECTLRAAIEQANFLPGDDDISFSIPASEPGYSAAPLRYTIQLASSMEPLSTTVTLDATTQPDYPGTPIIELEGSILASFEDGLTVTGDSVEIRGLVINRFPGDGIDVDAGATSTVIAGNYIGTDVTGLIDLGNGQRGINLASGSGPTTIGGVAIADRNVISGNGTDGIVVWASDGNTVIGNYIGTDVTGNSPLPNGDDGIRLGAGSDNNIIGQAGSGNILSGNADDGLEITDSSTGNALHDNMIGIGRNGLTPVPNGRHGVVLYDGANGNTIGGTGAGEGNVISSNTTSGVVIDGNNGGSTTSNDIRGNYIGTDASGTLDRGNGADGVHVFGGANGNTIGGPTAAHGNVISGNGSSDSGVLIIGTTTSGNVVQFNQIGTNAAGTGAIPNNVHGVRVDNAPSSQVLDNLISGNDVHGIYVYGASSTGTQILRNTIGTNAAHTAPLANLFDGIRLEGASSGTVIGSSGNGNVISGNAQRGIDINDNNANTVQGNWVGTDPTGTIDLGNGFSGIYTDVFNSSNNLIGGDGAGEGNTVAFNAEGITFDSGTNNAVLGNSIYSNDSLGIDLNDDGVTPNDALDADSGTNDLLNYPVMTSAAETAGTIAVDFDLEVPAGDYRIEFFTNTVADLSGFGEGETLVAFYDVVAHPGGLVSYSTSFGGSAGDILTATATEDLVAPFGSTSEFSATFITVAPDTTPPVITLVGANPQTIEVGSPYSELGATALDNVDGDLTGSIVVDASAVNTGVVGSYVVTYDVTDSSGNAAVQMTRTVDVVDTTIPLITLVGANPQTIEVGSPYSELGATAFDVGDGDLTGSIVIDATAVNTGVVGSYVVTYDVTDSSGNAAVQVTRTVDVVDTTIPVIALVGANPQTIEVGSPYSELGATASDVGDGDLTGSIVIDATAVNTSVIGSYAVTYDVSDSSGNAAVQVTRTVDVVDTTIPLITLVGANPQTIEVGSPYVELGAIALDNYDGGLTGSIVIDASAVNTSVLGSYIVTYDVTDSSGNAALQVTRTVDVVDTTTPVISLVGANPQTVEVGSPYSELGATALDNYDGDISGSIVIDATAVDTATVGSYVVTYDVTDASGNAAVTVIRTVDVVDTTLPVITLVGANPQTIEVGSPYSELGATAFDVGDGDLTGSIVIDATAVNTSVLGSYAVTYDVTDSSGNAAVQVTRTVDVVDTTIPLITLVGANPQTIEVGSPYVELGAIALDNYDGGLTGSIVIDASAVNTSVLGSYVVTYDVTDSSGNAALQVTRMVDIVDTTIPVITLVGVDPATVEVGSGYVDAGATAWDAVDGDLTGSIVTVNPVNTSVVGSYGVTYDVTDSSGNAAAQVIRTVDVVDTTIPVITLVGANPQTIEVGSPYVELGAIALDNYDGGLTGSIVVDASAVNTSVLGSYVVTYDVTDSSGNAALQVTRTVDVVDTTAPVITLVGANPQTIEVGSPYSELGATALDNYDGDLTGSIVVDASAVNTSVVGSYVVTYDVMDASGNAAVTVIRTVDVVDTTVPVISLVGANPQTIEVGSLYPELGATAFDVGDGDLTGSIVIDASAVNTSVLGSYVVTYDVTDSSGNAAVQVTRTVDVVDTTIPLITLVGANPQTIEVGSPYVELGAIALDNYDGGLTGSIVIDASAVNTSVLGSYVVTYDVTDSSGNAALQVTRTVDVIDTVIPVITMLGVTPVAVEAGSAYVDAGATAADGYDGDLTSSIATVNPVNPAVVGSYAVTYNVTDSSGNAAVQVTRTVNVVDTTIPLISLLGANPQTIEAGTPYVELGAIAMDNYDGNVSGSMVIDASAVNTALPGSYAVTYDVADSSGNPAIQVTRTVDVVDTTPPLISLLGANPQSIEVGTPYVELGAIAVDNIDGDISASIVVDAAAVNAGLVGSYVVTYDVVDSQANAFQVVRTVEVVDTTLPVISMLGVSPVTVEAGSTYVDAGATAADSYDGDLTSSIVTVNPVNPAVVGSYTITYDVTDANGNAAAQVTRTVAVVDSTVPVITLLGANPQTIEAGLFYVELGATAVDSYDGDVTASIVRDATAVDTAVVGSYVVTYDVTDSSGNAAVQVTRTVNVVDTTAPVISLLGTSPVTVELGSPYGDAGATAYDLAEGDITGSIVTVNLVDTSVAGSYIITYNVTDSSGNAAIQATRTVTVVDTPAPPNSNPIAGNDGYSVDEGATLTVAASGVLGNDTDVDGDPMTVSLITAPLRGTVALNADGSFVYVHTAGDATGDSFRYRVDDGRGGQDTGVVTIDVIEVNLPPIASTDEIVVAEDTRITVRPLANDIDPEGLGLTLVSVSSPSSGTVGSIDSTSFAYQPALNFFGSLELVYTVADPAGNRASGRVNVTVFPVNDMPEANPEEIATSSYEGFLIDVLANDIDVDGDELETVSASQAEHGIVEVLDSGLIKYTPDIGFVGVDTIVYSISDGHGGTAVSVVTIEVLSAALSAANSLAESLGINRLAVEAAPSLFDAEPPVLTMFAGVSLLADSFFQSVVALQVPLMFLGIAAAAALFFGRAPGMPLLAARRRRHYAVVMVEREQALNVHEEPSLESEIISKLGSTAGAIQAAGRPKLINGVSWIEIEGDESRGWVEARYLTEEIDLATFMEDHRPTAMVNRLAAELAGKSRLRSLLGPRGLNISVDRSLAHVTAEAAGRQEFPDVGGPSAGRFDGTGVVASFLSAYAHTDHVSPKTPHSSSALIPTPLWNFHYLAVPGINSDVPWLVYFEYRRGKPVIVALGADW